MKTIQEVTTDKLRGGFYTPVPLVDICLNRVVELCNGQSQLTVLEPSIGDGVFLQRLTEHSISKSITRFLGIEIIEGEAEKSRHIGATASFPTSILTLSTLDWAAHTHEQFDVVVGNPPFVRFQFVSKSDLHAIEILGRRIGLPFRGVSNLWLPILLGALDRLRPHGVMALVVPAEIFTGFATGNVRTWLLANFENLRIDMFKPGSFPDVLQEVVIISGRRLTEKKRPALETTYLEFAEHILPDLTLRWGHLVPVGPENWTRYLLSPSQLDALKSAQALPLMQRMGTIARIEVSIVTGANEFFSVTDTELAEYNLHTWAEPLLPRIRYATELVYSKEDHKETAANGAKAWLLNFSENKPDPCETPGPLRYLVSGQLQKLDIRYKTSIRTPWYRVPSVWAGKLLMSKRSHKFPRLVYNDAGVLTTDTIYRGTILPIYEGREMDLVAAFHNSLTLLTAEIEGRSFGGGVLELVPSEIARLTIPFTVDMQDVLSKLRCTARTTSSQQDKQELLITETNAALLNRLPGFTPDLMHELEGARQALLNRRLSRN